MPVFESSRIIQVFGSSLAMTLPALYVRGNEIKKGSTLFTYFSLNGLIVVSNCDDCNTIRDCLLTILKKLDDKLQESQHTT